MKLDSISNKGNKESGFIYSNTNNKRVVGKVNENDEYYTPQYAITPIIKYIKPNSNIWCPFDTDESIFVSTFRKYGMIVRNTHISTGNDFFKTDPISETEYIVSNPPYSIKQEVLQRLFYLKIPFAMLVGVVGIFENKKRFKMFRDNNFEIMYFDKRISYFKSYQDKIPKLNPPFSSVYICSGMLPKQIVFETLSKSDPNQMSIILK